MKNKILFLLFLVCSQTFLNAQSLVLTDNTQFSLLTCSPGPAGYEKFGHTAIRILDPSQSVDLIANWGIFDFDKPGFYYKFVKGETYYLLGISDTESFIESYRRRNSSVTEQVLNLTLDEKQRLFDAIMTNYQPENREYLYNFVFDNCATRPRDMIVELFAGQVKYYNFQSESRTFREWIGMYAGEKTWLMFGIDLVFGKDADKDATSWETMFLPEILCNEFQELEIVAHDSSVKKSVVSEKRMLLEKISVDEGIPFFSKTLVITTLIFIFGFLLLSFLYAFKRHTNMLISPLLLVTGIAGLIIFYLMFFSIHPLVKSNYNILWCNPLNIIFAVLIWIKPARKITKWYLIFYVISILVAFIVSILDIQSFNIAFLPIMGLALMSSLYWLYFYRKG